MVVKLVLSVMIGLVGTLVVAFVLFMMDRPQPVTPGSGLDFDDYLAGIDNAADAPALADHTVIQFAMPERVLNGPLGDTATNSYSYPLNTGFAPRSDYLGDVAKLPRFVLIAGDQDGAFYADRYEETMSAVTDKGRYVIVPGLGHLGIVDAPQTATAVTEFLRGL